MPFWRRVAALALLLLACRSRDAGPSSRPEQRAAAVSRLAGSRDEADLPALLVAEEDPSPLVRKAAAGAFAARGGPASIEALGKLVSDPDPEVAGAAARALSALPSEQRARELLAGAYPNGGPAARAEIASAIEAVGGSLREAVEDEARVLWDRNVAALANGTPTERAGAAEELGRSGRAEAVKLLLPLVDSDAEEEPRVAVAAARALGAVGDDSARAALEALLKDGPDAERVEAAAEALGTLGDPDAATALATVGESGPARLARAAVEALVALPQAPEVGLALCQVALHTREASLAARAAFQARARESECPEQPLLSHLSGQGAESVAALAALGQLRLSPEPAEQASRRMEQLLAAPDPGVRAEAARSLGRLGIARAAPALLRRASELRDRLERARGGADSGAPPELEEELGAVLSALSRLHAPEAGALARARLGDPSARLRAAAVDALGALGAENAGAIGAGLLDPDPRVFAASAEALGRIGPAAVPALSAAAAKFNREDPERCGALARALGETGSPEAVPALATLAEGSAAAAAATALGRIGTQGATAALLTLLERPDPAGRPEALDALGGLAASEAGPLATSELTNDRPEVRAAAARALGRIHFEPAAGRLEALRADYDGQVRRAAVEALARLPSRAERR